MNDKGKLKRNRNTLGKSERLRGNAEIREAYAQGRRWVGKKTVFWVRRGENASLRLATVASRKSVGNAVRRNRARRLLREAFRTIRADLEGNVDIVLIARRAINNACMEEVHDELRYLAKKAGLLKKEEHR